MVGKKVLFWIDTVMIGPSLLSHLIVVDPLENGVHGSGREGQ